MQRCDQNRAWESCCSINELQPLAKISAANDGPELIIYGRRQFQPIRYCQFNGWIQNGYYFIDEDRHNSAILSSPRKTSQHDSDLLFCPERTAGRPFEIPDKLVRFDFGVLFWLHRCSFHSSHDEPKTALSQSPLICPTCSETKQLWKNQWPEI